MVASFKSWASVPDIISCNFFFLFFSKRKKNCKKTLIYILKLKAKTIKHIKKFENFDFGRFNDSQEIEDSKQDNEFDYTESDLEDETFANEVEEDEDDAPYEDEYQELEQEQENRIRRWGDEEIVEKKKVNAGLQAYLDKQKSKKTEKDDDKNTSKKSKPDFLDLDKDGDKKETMKKAAKDAKENKDDKKEAKGLTTKQKKLPIGLQNAILKKNK